MKLNEILPSEFYSQQVKDRKIFETRAYQFAELTVPYAIRRDGTNSTTPMGFKRAQSYCGGLTQTLKSKIALTLLPPSTSSFRFTVDEKTLDQLSSLDTSTPSREEIFSELSARTDQINTELENQQIRATVMDMVLQLLVVGSVVIEKVPKKGLIIHPLKSFTVKTNRRGEAEAICIVEKLTELPEGITPKSEQDEYKLYTLLYEDPDTDKWVMKQELDGDIVGKEQTFKDEMDVPFRYLGWQWQVGDDYHRPYVEDYYDDMVQLNHLAELLTRGALASAKVTWLVNEQGGFTDKREIEQSPTGAYLHGRESDVGVVQAGKNFDFQVPMEREANLKKELAKAFLSNESATRQAERVTAYEIQLMARELESSTLGGLYSSMSLGFSKWLVHQIMKELKIQFSTFDVEILTGLDALGRSQEAQKLDGYMQRMAQLQLTNMVNMKEVAIRYASFDGINTVGLLKSDKEIQQEQQQAQQQMAQQQAQESIAKETGGMVRDAVTQSGQPPS